MTDDIQAELFVAGLNPNASWEVQKAMIDQAIISERRKFPDAHSFTIRSLSSTAWLTVDPSASTNDMSCRVVYQRQPTYEEQIARLHRLQFDSLSRPPIVMSLDGMRQLSLLDADITDRVLRRTVTGRFTSAAPPVELTPAERFAQRRDEERARIPDGPSGRDGHGNWRFDPLQGKRNRKKKKGKK